MNDEAFPPVGLDGDAAQAAALNKLAGYQDSTREHLVWEQILHHPGVSSVKVLQGASTSGDPVLTLTSASQLGQLQGYDSDTMTALGNVLGEGQVVTIPQRPVNYLEYSDVEAYVAIDPTTGTGSLSSGCLGLRVHPMLNGGGDDAAADANSSGSGCVLPERHLWLGNSDVRFSDGDHGIGESTFSAEPRTAPRVRARISEPLTRLTPLGCEWIH